MDQYGGYANTCRICLKKDEYMNLTICDVLNETITYGDMLTTMLHPMPIDMNPKLPQKLCNLCKENLVKVFNLRQLCFTSDRWIKSTIYGDVYLNANGFTTGQPGRTDGSVLETVVMESDNDDEPSTIPTFFLSTIEYDAPEIILDESFEHELELNQHSSDKPQQELYVCEICQRKFQTRQGCRRHIISKHNNTEEYRCEACSTTFQSNKGLERHKTTLRHQQSIKKVVSEKYCEKCSSNFTSIEEYSKHMLKHMVVRMDLNNTVCQVCGLSYSSTRNLRRHKKRIHARVVK